MDRDRARLAKLTMPRVARVLGRERLFERLDTWTDAQAVWVQGPPGCGKTTLVASYLQARGLPSVWYQVDRGDSDPGTLFGCLPAACTPGMDVSRLAGPTREYGSDLEAYSRRFFRALYATAPSATQIVFDSLQDAGESAEFLLALRCAQEEIPEGLRLLFLSRCEPPPAFARQRANGALRVLGWDLLRLTTDEALGIARLRGGASRDQERVARLNDCTAGWAAGLVLALELSSEPDGHCVATLGPSDLSAFQPIFDYLASEVLSHQPPEVRDFLLRSAPLPVMSADMAGRLTGRPDAAAILERMHRRGQFTFRRGGEPAIYAYHPLLRHFLLSNADRMLEPETVRGLLRDGCALLVANGFVEDAIELACGSGLWDLAARLVRESAPRLIADGRHQLLERWLALLPADFLSADPWLPYWRGMALGPMDPRAARLQLERAYDQFKAAREPNGCRLAWAAIVEGILLEWDDFSALDPWLAEAESMDEWDAPEPNIEAAAAFIVNRSAALAYRGSQGDITARLADRILESARGCTEPTRCVLLGANAFLHYLIASGESPRAVVLMELIEAANAAPRRPPVSRVFYNANRAAAAWISGEFGACRAAVAAGRRIAEDTGLRLGRFALQAQRVYAALTAGDLEQGRTELERLGDLADPRRSIERAHHLYLSSLLALLEERPDEALRRTTETLDIVTLRGARHQLALSRLAHAQALHACGQIEAAADWLAQGARVAAQWGAGLLLYQAELCAALFALDAGDRAAAREPLARAFARGRRAGYLNFSYWRTDVMTRLTALALEAGIEGDYARRLRRHRGLWPVAIRTLGGFRVRVNARSLAGEPHPAHGPLALLQPLVALGGRQVDWHDLVQVVRPWAVPRSNRGWLDTNKRRINRLLGHPRTLTLEDGCLRLDPERCWIDVEAFEALAERIGTLTAGPDPPAPARLAALAQDLLAAYPGPFLAAQPLSGLLADTRARLAARFLEAVHGLAAALDASAQHADAESLRRRALARHPEDQARRASLDPRSPS